MTRRATLVCGTWKSRVMLLTLGMAAFSCKPNCPETLTGTAASAAKPVGFTGWPGNNPTGLLEYLDQHVHFDMTLPKDSLVTVKHTCQTCDVVKDLDLLIVPVKHAYEINWRQAMVAGGNSNPEGHVVALVRNVSGERFEDFELDDGDVMYQWIGIVNEDGWRGHAYFTADENGVTKWFLPVQKVTKCREGGGNNRKKSAVKNNPGHSQGCEPIVGTGDWPALPPVADFTIPASVWVSCGGGCCQPQDPNRRRAEIGTAPHSRISSTQERESVGQSQRDDALE